MKSLKTIAEKRMGKKGQGFSVMKGCFRSFIESEKSKKFVEYAPCVQGALPAFLHSAKNMEKFLNASFVIHQNTRIKGRTFDSTPYKEEFGNANIGEEQWRHAFNAANVSLENILNIFTYWLLYRFTEIKNLLLKLFFSGNHENACVGQINQLVCLHTILFIQKWSHAGLGGHVQGGGGQEL